MELEDLKKIMEEGRFIAEMKDVFFEAMGEGYAVEGKLKKNTIIELPGSKFVPPYVRGPWKVVDIYLTTPLSSRSGGMTVISYEGIPVWMMQYFGEYLDEAIPFLKTALREAYRKKEFNGGRGPRKFSLDGFYYDNNVKFDEFYYGFQGEERIWSPSARGLGYHKYQGGSMVVTRPDKYIPI